MQTVINKHFDHAGLSFYWGAALNTFIADPQQFYVWQEKQFLIQRRSEDFKCFSLHYIIAILLVFTHMIGKCLA